MTRFVPYFVCATLTVSLAGVAYADANSSAKSAIQTAYNKMNAAFGRKDPGGYFAYVVSNGQFVDKSGRVQTAAAYQGWMKNNAPHLSSISVNTKVTGADVKGGDATVSANERKELTAT